MSDSPFREQITTEQELRDLMGVPSEMVAKKAIDHLDPHCREFIGRSPFLLLATADATGACDVSPRGDAAGFVRIVDDRHLVVPERPGNRRMDSLRNILSNPWAGLIFLIPGMEETLRINGSACTLRDPELLREMEVKGKIPKVGIGVESGGVLSPLRQIIETLPPLATRHLAGPCRFAFGGPDPGRPCEPARCLPGEGGRKTAGKLHPTSVLKKIPPKSLPEEPPFSAIVSHPWTGGIPGRVRDDSVDSEGGDDGTGDNDGTDNDGRVNSNGGSRGTTGNRPGSSEKYRHRTQIRGMRLSGLQSRETGRRKFASRRRVPAGGRLPVVASIPGHTHTD